MNIVALLTGFAVVHYILGLLQLNVPSASRVSTSHCPQLSALFFFVPEQQHQQRYVELHTQFLMLDELVPPSRPRVIYRPTNSGTVHPEFGLTRFLLL